MKLTKSFDETFLVQNYSIPFQAFNEDTAENTLKEGKIFSYTHFSIGALLKNFGSALMLILIYNFMFQTDVALSNR